MRVRVRGRVLQHPRFCPDSTPPVAKAGPLVLRAALGWRAVQLVGARSAVGTLLLGRTPTAADDAQLRAAIAQLPRDSAGRIILNAHSALRRHLMLPTCGAQSWLSTNILTMALSRFAAAHDMGRAQRVCKLWCRALAPDSVWVVAARELGLDDSVVTRVAFVADRLTAHRVQQQEKQDKVVQALGALGAENPTGLSLLRSAIKV